jgi:hypothetical protein
MKNKSMLAALAVLLMTSDVRAATCPETLSRVIGPDFTCVSLTDRLLVSLEGATEAEVIQAMKANGRLLDDHDTVLHFVSIGPPGGGNVNFAFENDKVVRIFGVMDNAPGGVNFIWNPTFACSDLPGSRYDRCNKSREAK